MLHDVVFKARKLKISANKQDTLPRRTVTSHNKLSHQKSKISVPAHFRFHSRYGRVESIKQESITRPAAKSYFLTATSVVPAFPCTVRAKGVFSGSSRSVVPRSSTGAQTSVPRRCAVLPTEHSRSCRLPSASHAAVRGSRVPQGPSVGSGSDDRPKRPIASQQPGTAAGG